MCTNGYKRVLCFHNTANSTLSLLNCVLDLKIIHFVALSQKCLALASPFCFAVSTKNERLLMCVFYCKFCSNMAIHTIKIRRRVGNWFYERAYFKVTGLEDFGSSYTHASYRLINPRQFNARRIFKLSV
jgi:hypothetical protein